MPRVLIIDDEAAVRTTLQDMLEEAGYEVVLASDGQRGIAVLLTKPVDLVITDILMPEKEGIETIRDIRERHANVKIIAMSGGGATGNMTFLELATKLGADEVLSKPIRFDALLKAVDAVLQSQSKSDPRAEHG